MCWTCWTCNVKILFPYLSSSIVRDFDINCMVQLNDLWRQSFEKDKKINFCILTFNIVNHLSFVILAIEHK